MRMSDFDWHSYMRHCIELALPKRDENLPSKPWAGALIIDERGVPLAEGRKHFLDNSKRIIHAECDALEKLQSRYRGNNRMGAAKNMTLVTTHEPCIARGNYYREASSSAERIVETGIGTVVFGVCGFSDTLRPTDGAAYLRRNGVAVFNYTGLEESIIYLLLCGEFIDQNREALITPGRPRLMQH